ncbi:MAG: hypothetical protein ABSH44_00505 [Bryobacteraceae bacterium]|jgi:hypothetical protein
MTRVQIRFRLQKPLDDAMLERISDAHAVYGIQSVQVAPSLDQLLMEYDATRLRPAEVESVLAGAGIPVEPAQGPGMPVKPRRLFVTALHIICHKGGAAECGARRDTASRRGGNGRGAAGFGARPLPREASVHYLRPLS